MCVVTCLLLAGRVIITPAGTSGASKSDTVRLPLYHGTHAKHHCRLLAKPDTRPAGMMVTSSAKARPANTTQATQVSTCTTATGLAESLNAVHVYSTCVPSDPCRWIGQRYNELCRGNSTN